MFTADDKEMLKKLADHELLAEISDFQNPKVTGTGETVLASDPFVESCGSSEALVVEDPIPEIRSFEDLRKCFESPSQDRRKKYNIAAGEFSAVAYALDPRLLVDYLPLWVSQYDKEVHCREDAKSAYRYLATEVGFDQEEVSIGLSIMTNLSLLKSSTFMHYADEKFITPYGSVPAGFIYGTYGVSPLIINKIVDCYESQTGFCRKDIAYAVVNNLNVSIVGANHMHDHQSRSFKKISEVKDWVALKFPNSESHEHRDMDYASSRCRELLRKLFFFTVLPLALLDNRFKDYVGCSLLDAEEFSDESCTKIQLAYLFFLSNCSQVAATATAKFKTLSGFDHKSIFAKELKSIKSEQEYRSVTFSLPEGKTEDVTLAGHVVSGDALSEFSKLCARNPHFTPVFDYLLPYMEASFETQKPLTFPPLLIAGPPGIGKTRFMADFFDVLGYPMAHCQSSQFTCGSGLVGLQSTWGTAQLGFVAKTMQSTKLFNPMIAYDELERSRMSASLGNGVSVESALMRLLEPLEAKRFSDAFGPTVIDVSGVNWIFSCNDPMMIPSALMTRLNKVCIYPPTDEEVIDNIHKDIFADLVNKYAAGHRVQPWIAPDALDHLRAVYDKNLNFRATIIIMKDSINKLLAGAMGATYLTMAVIHKKAKSAFTYN
jgi:hypothetical protein